MIHTYSGILACLDGYMNIAMEQTEEYVNGQLKQKYGDAFIRGNNGMLVSEGDIMSTIDVCFFIFQFSTSALSATSDRLRSGQ